LASNDTFGKRNSASDSEILGSSTVISALRALIKQCADSNAPVLIRGASGVGKELVCRELHNHSPRYSQRLVAINCGAIPGQLLESELFGHRKGSFTGATCDRKGRFELANNGTLFLDEIGDMPLDLQVKFLRVLEERQIEPVGANHSIDVDVRIVAATHRDLTQMIEEGTFREDLYYRLNVIPLTVPSLADRSEDSVELVQHFSEKFSAGRKPIRLNHVSKGILQAYSWPGNVRELSNFVQRLSVLYPSQLIDISKIPREFIPAEMLALFAGLSERVGGFERDLSSDEMSEHFQADYIAEPDQATARANVRSTRQKVPASRPKNKTAQPDLFGNEADALESLNFFDDDERESQPDDEMQNFESIIRLSETLQELPVGGVPTKNILNTLEANLIRTALAQTGGNVSHAAGLLQLGRTTVIQKMAKYDIKVEERV
jgi:sigma-54 specific flagellar transcriptional regulator A